MKYEDDKYYYVYNRGANRQDIFRGRGDYGLCLHLLARYIHYNPVAAGMVLKPEAWEYSDYRDWSGIRKADLSDLTLRDRCFENPLEYRSLMDEYVVDREISRFTLEGE